MKHKYYENNGGIYIINYIVTILVYYSAVVQNADINNFVINKAYLNIPVLAKTVLLDKEKKNTNNDSPSNNPTNNVEANNIETDYVEKQKNIDYIQELKNLGYYIKESDDENLNIRNAVIRFQSDYNLIVDGIFGERSMGTLKKRLQTLYFEYPDIVKSPPVPGKWIAINKTKRILTLYEGDKVLKKYPIAIGNPPTLTPSGKFTIVVKVINPAWGGGGYAKPIAGGVPQNPLGYRWLGLSIGKGNTYGIHGTNNPYSIGTNVSHGCVRMLNSDVEKLFDLVPKGTAVWIGTDQQLQEWGVIQDAYK